MADRFWAATKIKFGKRTEDGSQDGKYERVTFNVGDEVTGLSRDDMKGLWDAGALSRTAPAKEEDDASSDAGEDEAGGSAAKPKPVPAKPSSPSTKA